MGRSISASSFRSLLHCPHALHLDHHGDPAQRTELSEFEEYLLDEGRRFEQEVLEGETFVQPEYPEGDLDAGARTWARFEKAGAGAPDGLQAGAEPRNARFWPDRLQGYWMAIAGRGPRSGLEAEGLGQRLGWHHGREPATIAGARAAEVVRAWSMSVVGADDRKC